ncbi:hypothetical protein OsI_20089 [Oryza sativa Indica Group]|uniref:Reverse transcriptase domain-containing protein n=1 Tax=Oryza sativa subsp. indica TaxID=39946 RepID=B8AYK4_ORYSI|nr:hypothetical protein OsI_20089 [Oryza sativa Indica Group]
MDKGGKKKGVDLEGLFRGLKLSREELRGMKGSWCLEEKDGGKVQQAVGKLFSPRAGVYNLPFGLMNVDTGRLIGNKIGKALEVDTDEDGSAVGGYLRVKVLMDARKALIRGVMMEGVAGEKENWCGVKYEFLPNFCYSCGVLGHVEECDDKRKSGVEKGGSSGVGGKSASRDDPELRDDAESPGKGHPKIRMGGAPKKLTFVGDGSSGSLTEERGHKKLLEITAPSEPQLVPTTGEVANGLDGKDARGKEHSTMQGSISLESNVGQQQTLPLAAESGTLDTGHSGTGDKRKATFKRRPRVMDKEVGAKESAIADTRKRSVTEEMVVTEEQKKQNTQVAALEDCQLHDLGFVGDAFTWRNHHHLASNYIKERLDRAVANGAWRARFPLVRVINGDPRHSDHRPVIVETGATKKQQWGQPLEIMQKFEARWLEEEECQARVEEAWANALEGRNWRSAGRSQALTGKLTENMCCGTKLERLLDQQHIYWKQRAHSTWLTKGDRNTKFFHAQASERKKRNTIQKLQDGHGGLVAGNQLKSFILNQHQQLFRSNGCSQMDAVLQCVQARVTPERREGLAAPYQREEVWVALKDMGDLKAPGADVISKVIVNRLKVVLLEIISPSQSAFVPRRLITYNVLLAYELTHYLNQRKKGKNGVAAIKLDMSKAYDRVEWDFLRHMMLRLGFHDQWVNLVMKCVTSVTYRIKINGEHSDQIYPQRGLRQGDPLSPYLFIICAEGLSALLQKAQADGKIEGIKVCRDTPRINHLFFADDSLVLMRAGQNDAQELRRVLNIYEVASGQVINKDKSSVLFSPNTLQSDRMEVRSALCINQEAKNERYLGLPVSIGKSRRKAFEYIKRKVWLRIQGWQEKLLSKAGKEILVKAVAQLFLPMRCHVLI